MISLDTKLQSAAQASARLTCAESGDLVDDEGEEEPADPDQASLPFEHGAHLRPGIVHRLDKGTTGVLLLHAQCYFYTLMRWWFIPALQGILGPP